MMVSAAGASIAFSDVLFIVVLLLFLAPYIQGAVKYATGINLAAAAAAEKAAIHDVYGIGIAAVEQIG